MQGRRKVVFLCSNLLNGPIMNDCGHFAYQPLLTFKPYHFKLNLANGPDKRDWVNLKNPAVRNCSGQQLHINAVITIASADVNFLFIWLHLVCLNNAVGVLLPFALRKWLQTMRIIVNKYTHISCLTLFCHWKSVGFLLGLPLHECYVSGFEITVNKYII